VVLQELLRPLRPRSLTILLVERAVHDFHQLVAKYVSLVGDIVSHTLVRSNHRFMSLIINNYFAD
jgi:hypothetical protein